MKNPKIYLAPMEDVSDFPFRKTLLEIGKPDMFFTEFVNVDGLVSQGKKHVAHRLEKSENEKTIVQFWGNAPEKFVKAVGFVKDFGFEGVNINLGCPVKKVLKVGCGSALIQRPDIVENIVKGIQDAYPEIPLSVKTRLGFQEADVENWIGFLLRLGIKEIFIHGRTAKQVYSGNADWDAIHEVVKMNDTGCRIIGNGDVHSVEQAHTFMQTYGVDGVMIGREVLRNPWVFGECRERCSRERVDALLLHMCFMLDFTKNFPEKGWQSLKKFYHAYLRNEEFLTSLRKELFLKTDLEESIEFVKKERKKIS